jgi:hypothetical protein
MKERIQKLLEQAINAAEEMIEEEDIDDGLDILIKASQIYRNISSSPDLPEPIDASMDDKTDEELIALAKREPKGNP